MLFLLFDDASSALLPVCVQLSGLEGRDAVCRELSLSPLELNSNCPLLLQLVKRGQQRASKVMTHSSLCHFSVKRHFRWFHVVHVEQKHFAHVSVFFCSRPSSQPDVTLALALALTTYPTKHMTEREETL